MRLLYINSHLVDIDETTSIGIDYQAYDLKEPSKRKTIISNTFSIPKTAHNLAIFGYPDNPQSTSDIVYSIITCDYWIDNNHIIESGVIRIEDITDRINLYVTNKNTLWDDLKTFTWEQFIGEYLTWLENVKGVPIHLDSDDFNAFLTPFITATEDIILPFYYGNYLLDATEDATNIFLNTHYYSDSGETGSGYRSGGHFCIYAKSIFEFLEYKYSVNFCTKEVALTGNIWDDAIASLIYTPARDIVVNISLVSDVGSDVNKYTLTHPCCGSYFYPLVDVKDKDGKTMFDFVNAFFQKFNILVDEITLSTGTKAFRLARFDDIKTLAVVKDFSKKLQSITSYKPNITGYSQHNIIKIKSLYPEAAETFGSKDIICLNKNLDATADLFSIDEYLAKFKAITGAVIPDLSIQESFKTFQFFISSGVSSSVITIKVKRIGWLSIDRSTTANLPIPAHYSLANEYLFIEEIIQKPKVYTIKKYLSITDIMHLEFFCQYYIRQLNGSFYINKISGFNPQKSTEPTTIEVIRISSKTPTPVFPVSPVLSYYTDGNNEEFTDGAGNYFY